MSKEVELVSIPERVLEALKRHCVIVGSTNRDVSIPERVLEALKHLFWGVLWDRILFQSLKGF